MNGVETILFDLFASLALLSGMMVIRAKNPVHSVLFLILVFCQAAGLLILIDLDFFAMVFLVVYVGAIAVLFLFVVMMLHIKLTEMNENILRYLPIGGLIGVIFLCEILLLVNQDVIPVLPHTSPTLWTSLENFSFESFFFFKAFWAFCLGKLSWTQWSQDSHEFHQDLATIYQGIDQYSIYLESYVCWVDSISHVTPIEALGQIMYTYYFAYFILASIVLLVAMIGAIVLTMHQSITVKRQQVFEQNTREFARTVQKIRLIGS